MSGAIGAIKRMVAAHPDGWAGMAVKCGKNPTVLAACFGSDSRYVPSLIDALIISQECIKEGSAHCMGLVDIVAEQGGIKKLPVVDMASAAALQGDFAAVVKEAADVLMEGVASIADGDVSDNDYARVSKELNELREAVRKAQQDLDAAHRAGKLRRVA